MLTKYFLITNTVRHWIQVTVLLEYIDYCMVGNIWTKNFHTSTYLSINLGDYIFEISLFWNAEWNIYYCDVTCHCLNYQCLKSYDLNSILFYYHACYSAGLLFRIQFDLSLNHTSGIKIHEEPRVRFLTYT